MRINYYIVSIVCIINILVMYYIGIINDSIYWESYWEKWRINMIENNVILLLY